MTRQSLTFQLAMLTAGRRICIERAHCDALFPPGIATTDGRQGMYALANAQGCTVEWADSAIAFVKR